MNTLAPQTGLLIMFSYALFNLYNILLLRIGFPFITIWLLSAGIVYLIYRFHRFMQGQQGFSQSEILGFFLIVLSSLAISLQYLNLQEYAGADGVHMLQNQRTEWVLSILWFFAGGAVAIFNIKESPVWAIIVLTLTGLAFTNGLDEQLMVSYLAVEETGIVENISHISMEKHVLFLLIFAYCLSPKTKWIVAIAGMFLLFSMGGRTSLFVFAISVIGMNVGKRYLKNLIYLGVIGLLLMFSTRYAVENQIIDIEDVRIKKMLLIGGVEDDSSFLARVNILETSLQYLDNQFLYGDPTIIPQTTGSTGGYIHNILSVWQLYGFFVFACVVLVLLFSLRRMIVLKLTNPTPKIIFGSFFLIYVTVSVIFSKGSHWDLLWFTLGFWTLLPVTNLRRRRTSKATAFHHTDAITNQNQYMAQSHSQEQSHNQAQPDSQAQSHNQAQPQATAASYRSLGDSAFQNNTTEALEAYQNAVSVWPDDIDAWNKLGHLYTRIGNLDDAINANERVGELAASTDDQPMWSAVSLRNLGNVYRLKGDMHRAIGLYEKSLDSYQAIGDKKSMASIYGNLGNMNTINGDLDQAIELHEYALAIHEELDEKQGIAGDYANLGIAYKNKGKLDRAIELFEKSLDIFKQIDHKEGIANQYSNLGNYYKTIGYLDRAREHWEKSIAAYNAIGSPKADRVGTWLTELPTKN